MYSQFSITNQLPDIKHALNFQKCLILGNYMMLISLIVILACITITFVFDDYVVMSIQIFAHIATIVFAATLKLGYVIRCIALHGFGKRDF